ncbi:RsmD family RNA methyltransferase [Pelagicoccus sp. SDUM812003]|uniref:RsmD family RNA methyltransferase n=1 Tax=Pelagicoccus sp. SDUM812003 TaxID=3041267 RepID=UPI00280C765C|nr:RsmD family RNA methyltransferase [Pelagicoccus sp. SDUM812003]MDQ8204130.1 RsmD family RNA methyltransferase [Pelagicoccus sp. SDUM812003]
MRISGGKARGVTLRVDKKAVHRPAMDKLRQGIFSSIGPLVDGARVCDLFAGTGSYGLEALSRGASHCTFVELNRRATSMISQNISIVAKSMQEKLDTRIVIGDVTKFANPDAPTPFDFIFVDPPYEAMESLTPKLFPIFDQLLAEDGLVIFECPGRFEPAAPGWRPRKRLGKGLDQPTACLLLRDR